MSEPTLKTSLSDFVENPDNPSIATDEAFERLVGKIRRNPDGLSANRIAYVVDDSRFPGKKLVLSGNKRLRALNRIAAEGGLILDGETKISPDGEIPAVWTEDVTPMTTEQRRIYLVAANVIEGEWEVSLLNELYTPDELSTLLGEDALDAVTASAEMALARSDDHADDSVELKIKLPSEDYRHVYLALISRNDDISRAFMEIIDGRA